MDLRTAIDLISPGLEYFAGKSAEPITRAEPGEKLAHLGNDSDVERILTEHYGPPSDDEAEFDRRAYNAEANRLDQEYAEQRAMAERAAAQSTLDSLRANGSNRAPALKRFQR